MNFRSPGPAALAPAYAGISLICLQRQIWKTVLHSVCTKVIIMLWKPYRNFKRRLEEE